MGFSIRAWGSIRLRNNGGPLNIRPLLLVVIPLVWSRESCCCISLEAHHFPHESREKKQPIASTSVPLHWASQCLLHLNCLSLSIFLLGPSRYYTPKWQNGSAFCQTCAMKCHLFFVSMKSLFPPSSSSDTALGPDFPTSSASSTVRCQQSTNLCNTTNLSTTVTEKGQYTLQLNQDNNLSLNLKKTSSLRVFWLLSLCAGKSYCHVRCVYLVGWCTSWIWGHPNSCRALENSIRPYLEELPSYHGPQERPPHRPGRPPHDHQYYQYYHYD